MPSPESSTDAPAEIELPAGENGYSVDSSTPEADAGSDEEGAPWRRPGDRETPRIARPPATPMLTARAGRWAWLRSPRERGTSIPRASRQRARSRIIQYARSHGRLSLKAHWMSPTML